MKLYSKNDLNRLTYDVIGAAIEVHKTLGPGLLESVYHKCMKVELKSRSIPFLSSHPVRIQYKGFDLDTELRCDLLIDKVLVIELKSVDSILPVHEAQLLTYMKLLNAPKGILINFNCYNLFRDGQKTFVNELFRLLED